MIEVSEQIGSVSRGVNRTGKTRVITISRIYSAAVEDVWDACTNPERIPRWFLPISGELRLGGRYQLEGQAGGTVERCDPPKGFSATWEYGGEISWIELRLTPDPEGGGTRFELDHIIPADDDRWAEFGPGAVGIGWDMMLVGLTLHLASGDTVDPAKAAGWMASAEGKDFVLRSGKAWCEADIAAGADRAEAQAAADRTIAAYSG